MAAIIFVIVLLTTADGFPIWVETQHILSMRAPGTHCPAHSGALIRFDNGGSMCVSEKPNDVFDKARVK